MAKKVVVVAVPTSVATGAAKDVSDMTTMSLSLATVGTATYKVKVSYDKGSSFVQHGADITADADVTLPDAVTQVQIQCSAYTSGTPKCGVAGIAP